MPQMAPTMWTLCLIFTLALILIITNYLYFMKEVSNNTKTNNKQTMTMKIWMW